MKCTSLRNPFTRARIVTWLSARVVPLGKRMIGTSILRARTTVTVGTGVSREAAVAVRVRSQPLRAAATVARELAVSR